MPVVQRLHCTWLVEVLMQAQTLRWWTLLLRGVAAMLFGMLCLAAPPGGLPWLAALFGIYALADGMLTLAIFVRGATSLVVGTAALVWPAITASELWAVVIAWAILVGVIDIARTLRPRQALAQRWLPGFEGSLSVAFGALLLGPRPASAHVLASWLGIYALVVGATLLHSGLRVCTAAHSIPPARSLRDRLGPWSPLVRRT